MSDRRAIILLIVASLLACALHVVSGRRHERSTAIDETVPLPSAVAGATGDSAVAEEPPRVEIAGVIQRGDLLGLALIRGGISANLSDKILDALAKTFDPRKARPGDVFKVVLDTERSLLGFQYERVTGESYRVEPLGASLVASILPERLERRLVKREGVLENSLYESVRQVGGSPEEVTQIADIFGGSFDFVTDSRRGDRFTYVAEGFYDGDRLRRLGRIQFAEYTPSEGGEAMAGVYYKPQDASKGAYYAPDGRSLQKAFLRSPLSYRRITSRFSRNRLHPILKHRCAHLGVDYGAPTGTPVSTVADGVVAHAGWNGGMGKCVKIRHTGGITTMYGHLSRFGSGIRSGQRVEQGQVIGYVGSTGMSTGPHLHFQIDRNGAVVDPLTFESPGGPALDAAEIPAFLAARDAMAGLMVALRTGVPTPEQAPVAAVATGPERMPRS